MKIGFSTIYAWRPHVDHMYFLANLAKEAGHEVSFLVCDSDLSSCYSRELRPDKSSLLHCMGCRAGGLRSFATENVSSIGRLKSQQPDQEIPAAEWAKSSASTLGRFESDEDFSSPEFKEIYGRLTDPVRTAYGAAKKWMNSEKLDALCLFNGRIDATRAILEAARSSQIPFMTIERTWFGDGIQMMPMENCLGLQSVNQLVARWSELPLTRQQAAKAAKHIASRFLKNNDKEWRSYNKGAKTVDWPTSSTRRRILLAPGSRNEVWGHPDWESGWTSRLEAFDATLKQLSARPEDVVLRCHPNWGEKIGLSTGEKIERHYASWAAERGFHCISSTDPTSTLGLIEQCDAIIVCGGSAALEAGALGRQVIATTPSIYQMAGFQSFAYPPSRLAQLTLDADLDEDGRSRRAADIARKTLRFAYTIVYRFAQYVDYVKCKSTTSFEFFEGADPARFLDALLTGELQPDDTDYAGDMSGESEVLDMIANRRWQDIVNLDIDTVQRNLRPVRRRFLFRPVDKVRELLPRGDR